MTSPYTLYGAPLSLYTGKARAYMIYKNQAFEEVFSSFKVYKNIIVPKYGCKVYSCSQDSTRRVLARYSRYYRAHGKGPPRATGHSADTQTKTRVVLA
jgi:hypothetical protein